MALAATEDLVDITSAFTNDDLDEKIYIKQPEGFKIGSSTKVCRLCKSLYGLKQSAHQWNKKLHSVLTEMGFKHIESDRSVYVYSGLLLKLPSLVTAPIALRYDNSFLVSLTLTL